MQDLIALLIKRFGPWVILALILVGVAVWFIAHLNAEPGEKISLFWGMVEYTKGKTQSEPKVEIKSKQEQKSEPLPEVSGTKDPSSEVRKVVKESSLQTLREIVRAAKIPFDAGQFYDAAQEYESATRFISPDAKIDKSLLEKARSKIKSDPETACIDYQKFFSKLIIE